MNTRRPIPREAVAEFVSNWEHIIGYGPALAERYGIPLPTAYRWIYETRKAGLLPRERPCRLCKGTGTITVSWGRRYDPGSG